MDIAKVGVVGAGQMGSGIAEVCALAGHDVYLLDITQERLDDALAAITESINHLAARRRISEGDGRKALARLATGLDYEGFRDCQLAIEAATEDEQIKKRSFTNCVRSCRPTRSSPPIPHPFQSPGSRRKPTGQGGFSAPIS